MLEDFLNNDIIFDKGDNPHGALTLWTISVEGIWDGEESWGVKKFRGAEVLMQDTEVIPQQLIENNILIIRGKKVMLDRDLVMLYGVETRMINQAVRRNIKRFPEDFMFQLTIIDVFAADKQCLLYIITKNIFELGLSVYSSKIATHVDQIVDVFYVKDRSGHKIMEPERITEIKKRLLTAIEEYQKV